MTVGLHPRHVASLTQEELGRYKYLVKTPHVGALGEVGLDYTAKNIPRQREVLQEILSEHKDLSKPVILHLRGTRGHEDRTYDCPRSDPTVFRSKADDPTALLFRGSLRIPSMAKALPERLCQLFGTRDLLLREPEARTEGSARRSPPPRDPTRHTCQRRAPKTTIPLIILRMSPLWWPKSGKSQ